MAAPRQAFRLRQVATASPSSPSPSRHRSSFLRRRHRHRLRQRRSHTSAVTWRGSRMGIIPCYK
ncbi:hypothetical protein U1Q18_012405 [Sarracenia purpurea var. burkii]